MSSTLSESGPFAVLGESQPTDTQPADAQPTESQPTDTQPADAQPTGARRRAPQAAGTQPVATEAPPAAPARSRPHIIAFDMIRLIIMVFVVGVHTLAWGGGSGHRLPRRGDRPSSTPAASCSSCSPRWC